MIPLYKVHMPRSVLKPLKKVLFSGYIAEGKKAKEFETKFGNWIGNENTVVVNSCTSAITLSLLAAGVRQGDKVISTPMTCVATNTPIKNIGAEIVWADVEPETGNIDPASVERLIDDDVKAMVFVDWAGTPANLAALCSLGNKHSVFIIEDAAHALGAKYRGIKIGNYSDYTCFSFQAIKHLTTIDGGAVCTGLPAAKWMRRMRWFGLDREEFPPALEGHTEMAGAGYKMNLNDVSATIGLEQLKYIDEIVALHKDNGRLLSKELDGHVDFVRPFKNKESSYWFFTLLLPPSKRKQVSDYLTKAGIQNGVSHVRNDNYRALGPRANYPGLAAFSERALNIPCGWWVSAGQVEFIIKKVKQAVK